MEKKTELNNTNKVPLYVAAYEKLYTMITSGELRPGDKLPGENQLAESLSVSRGTLRQALLLLQEDGLVINRQGSGNYINEVPEEVRPGLEHVNIIGLEYCKKPCDFVLQNVLYQPATKIVGENLNIENAKLVAIFEVLFQTEGTPVGTMDIFVPYSVLNESDIPLDDLEKLSTFIVTYIRDRARDSKVNMRIVESRARVSEKLGIETGNPLVCFYEIMHSETGEPVVYSKTYCIPEHYDFYINAGR